MMAQRDPGFPFQGEQYNAPLGHQVGHGLAGAFRRANAETFTHPGLYWARYDDIMSIQLSMRPGLPPIPGIDLNDLLGADHG